MSEDLKPVNIRVSPEVHSYFKERSRKTGASMSALMFLALEEQMKKEILEHRKFDPYVKQFLDSGWKLMDKQPHEDK